MPKSPVPRQMNSKIDGPGPTVAVCETSSDRKAMFLKAVVAILTATGCYLLYVRAVTPPVDFSLLHGPFGVAVGVIGIFLALAATPALRIWLVIGWLCLWFTTGLAELRASAITDGIVVGGVVPYSDANNFLREASRLIEGHNLTPWASRPLADTYLAGLLYVAGDHLTLALVLAGLFSAVAIGVAAIEVRNCMGIVAATLWTWLLLVYYRRYLGEMLSEHPGIALGALGAALLLRAFNADSRRCLWCGLFILSMALNARAGAFLILPALIATLTWRARHLDPIRMLVLASVSVLAAFVINFSLLKLVGAPNGRLMSNYRDTMYGIIFGGNWEKAAVDIPNYKQMDLSQRASAIDSRVFAAIKANPSLIWRGAARNWSDFFFRSKAALGPFSFFRHPNTEFVLLLLSGTGLLCSMARSERLSPLILAAGLGIVLSVPFVPTTDADRMRAYAATMPAMFLIPAFSFAAGRAWIARLLPSMSNSGLARAGSSNPSPADSPNLVYCAVFYLAVTLLLPLFARFLAPVNPSVSLRERGSDVELTLDLNRATWIELAADSDSLGENRRRVSAEKFKQGIFGSFHYYYPKQAEFLEAISRPGVVLVCPGSSATAFLTIESKHLNGNGGTVVIHGRAYVADSSYAPTFLENSIVIPAAPRQRSP